MQDKIIKFADAVRASFEAGSFKNVVIHSPADKSSELLKIKGTPRSIGGKNILQFESFMTEGRVSHENVTGDELVSYVEAKLSLFRRADLTSQMGSAALMINKKGDKATYSTHGKLFEADAQLSAVRHLQSGNYPEKTCLSAAGGTHKCKVLTRLYTERQVLKHRLI